jgi:hypothetical protein
MMPMIDHNALFEDCEGWVRGKNSELLSVVFVETLLQKEAIGVWEQNKMIICQGIPLCSGTSRHSRRHD